MHLVLGCHRINGEQWVKQFISKLLHVTHIQWIFRNFTLHDKQRGWLRRKEKSERMGKNENLWETDADDIPEGSRFLLEMDYDKLLQSNFHDKTYWVVATEAAIVAGKKRATIGIRKRSQLRSRPHRSTRERLRITEVEKEIESCDWAYRDTRGRRTRGPSHRQAVIITPSKRKSGRSDSRKWTRTRKR